MAIDNQYGFFRDVQLDAFGQVLVESNGTTGPLTSTLNMSTTLLTNGATYTGTAELNAYYDVMVIVKTDQNGVFYCQFSPDGINWDSSLSFQYDTTRINPPHIFVKGSRYFRVVFNNNSGSNQTYFRLHTYYGSFNKLTSPINGTLAENYDATIVRPTEYKYEVAMGKRQGATTWNKYGYNMDVDNGVYETIWAYGGTFSRINTASTFNVVSSSSEDKLTTGAGAWNIVLYYIDSNRLAQVGVVQLNGTSSVTTSFSGLGINRAALYNTGSSDVNVGDITIIATTDSTVQGYIPAGEGSTQQAIFFTQANHTFLVDWLTISANKLSGSNPKLTIRGWVYSYVSTAKYLIYTTIIDTSVEAHIYLNPSQPFVVGEKSILWFEAKSDTNDSTVSCRFSGIEQRII